MTTHETPALEAIRRKSPVGRDGTGATHYYCQVRRTVYVVDGDRLQHVEPVADALRDWVDYVARQRGWETLWYSPEPDAAAIVLAGAD